MKQQDLGKAKQQGVGATWRGWAFAAATLMLGPGLACGDSEEPDGLSAGCTRVAEHFVDCGLLSSGPLDCSNATIENSPEIPAGRADEFLCELSCFESAECIVLEALVCGVEALTESAGQSLLSCFIDCAERFGFQCVTPGTGFSAVPFTSVCNGYNDCDDGSDEEGCQLFECGDGQSVATSAVCDGYFDCAAGQDEDVNCPAFVCADGFEVPESFRCDTDADCLDGSDEAGCPERGMPICGG